MGIQMTQFSDADLHRSIQSVSSALLFCVNKRFIDNFCENEYFFSPAVACPVVFQEVRATGQAHIGLKDKNYQ